MSNGSTHPDPDPNDPRIVREGDEQLTACPGDDVKKPSEYANKLSAQIRAELLKPIVVEDLYFAAPATKTERDAANDAYRKAAQRPNPDNHVAAGPLWATFKQADDAFRQIAADLQRQTDGQTRLQRWLADYLAPGKKLFNIFAGQQAFEAAQIVRMGARECRYLGAEARSKFLEKAYGDWKTPVQKIETIITSYATGLTKLRCDIHNDDNYAIYQFWFEVAPKHLQLRDVKNDQTNTPGIVAVCESLTKFPSRRRALASGEEKDDGSLYLLNPDTHSLEWQRKHVLEMWRKAIGRQADLRALFEESPDDSASLKKKLDELKKAEADAKKQFEAVPA